jgi:hypothetical protein
MSSLLLLERLSDGDLAILAEAAREAGGPRHEMMSRLRADPTRISQLIDRPEIFSALFRTGEPDRLVFATPFLAFSVLLAQIARDLSETSFVQEWTAPGRRVPVFDVGSLHEFAADEMRRLFLAELLSSYTHVASGTVWTRSGGRWRRRRFSELDPVQLAQLAEVVPEWERPAVYRRLGDLALFLTGVFPDHAGRWLDGHRLDRLSRALSGKGGWSARGADAGAVQLLESVGQRAYELAAAASDSPSVAMAGVVRELPDRFSQARRILTFLTERYLFPMRNRWFPLA